MPTLSSDNLVYKILDRLNILLHDIFPISPLFTNDMLQYRDYDIGDYTYWNPIILNYGTTNTVKIGKFCSISVNVQMILAPHHRSDWISTYPFMLRVWPDKIEWHPLSKWHIIIGNDVRIGRNVIIMDGITIWDGAIIGAWSVVTKDIEPYTMVWGVPAKPIRQRFDEESIARLLRIKRWDRPKAKIMKHIHILSSPEIGKLLDEIS